MTLSIFIFPGYLNAQNLEFERFKDAKASHPSTGVKRHFFKQRAFTTEHIHPPRIEEYSPRPARLRSILNFCMRNLSLQNLTRET
ncbi:hypothetical protein WN944_022026 [Citrus x changshan-huyou]|uniref:Uncharacterized protein n=1 Tax=Citrus x changshan-huyou TaxID=2935761 RepID=A0AAP0N415_9ROSI